MRTANNIQTPYIDGARQNHHYSVWVYFSEDNSVDRISLDKPADNAPEAIKIKCHVSEFESSLLWESSVS